VIATWSNAAHAPDVRTNVRQGRSREAILPNSPGCRALVAGIDLRLSSTRISFRVEELLLARGTRPRQV
jgi:hypothetical protein